MSWLFRIEISVCSWLWLPKRFLNKGYIGKIETICNISCCIFCIIFHKNCMITDYIASNYGLPSVALPDALTMGLKCLYLTRRHHDYTINEKEINVILTVNLHPVSLWFVCFCLCNSIIRHWHCRWHVILIVSQESRHWVRATEIKLPDPTQVTIITRPHWVTAIE